MKPRAARTGISCGLGWRLVFLAGFFPGLAGLTLLGAPRLAAQLCGVNLAISGIAIVLNAWFSLRNGDPRASKFLWFMMLWAGVSDAVALIAYRLGTPAGISCAMISLAVASFGLIQAKNERARLATPTLDAIPQFQDEKFEQPGDWITLREDDSFTQRYLRSGKSVFCETIMTARGDAAQAITLLRGAWDWWGRGYAVEFSERADGSTDQILIPVYWYWCHVRMRIWPPARLADGTWRLPANLAGSFEGPASFDVYSEPGTDRLTIRGRFQGITDNVPIVWQDLVTRSHLWAEAGILPLPFPSGTGWPGLRRLLEAKCHGDTRVEEGGMARGAGNGAA